MDYPPKCPAHNIAMERGPEQRGKWEWECTRCADERGEMLRKLFGPVRSFDEMMKGKK